MCFLQQSHMVVAVRTPLSQRTTDLTQWTSIKWQFSYTTKSVISFCGVVSRVLCLKFWGNSYFPFLWCSGCWLIGSGSCGQKMATAIPSTVIVNSIWSKERSIYSIFLLLQVEKPSFSFQTKLWLQWAKMSRHNHLTDRMSSWHFSYLAKMS